MAKRSSQRQLFDLDSTPAAAEPSAAPANAPLAPEEAIAEVVSRVASPAPDSLEGKKIYVVDANSLIHQVFHALPPMSSPQGEPVGAVFGFSRDLFYLLEEKRPDYLFCAFDLPGKTFRHEMYQPYKAQRPAMDVDLASQLPLIRQVIEAMGVPALGLESFEADDILATLAQICGELGGHCFLVTGDKDCRQLITDRVVVYNIRKDQLIDRAALRADWGIAPEQVVDFQALVGDSVDNVPGVPLVGPKFARQLLEQYGTLDSVLDHAEEVPGAKRKQSLLKNRPTALLSRDLVRLNRRVPVPIDWNGGRVGRIDRQRLEALFRRFGFRTLVERVDSLAARFGQSAAPAPPPRPEVCCHLVDTPEKLAALVGQLKGQKMLSVDLETTNLWPRWAEIVGIAMTWKEDEAWYVPLRGPAGECCLDPQPALDALRPVLQDAAIEKIGQNLKYDMIVLRSAGVELVGVTFDCMVASYLLDAGQRNHSLDEIAKHYLGYGKLEIPIGTGKSQKRMDEVPIRQVAEYAAQDVVLPLRLRPMLLARLVEAGLEKLFSELEIPLIGVLAELEYNGVKVDRPRLADLSRRFGDRLAAIEREIRELAGHELNIASPKQLQQVLFQELKLPVVKKTNTGASTDVEVLEELAALHPLPAKIVEYRQYAKLKGTYVDALPDMIYPRTGRVHASFNQVVAATGRLSSSDPNLQNIPVRTEEGREIRSAFVPGQDGWLLLAADYSQIELRVLAHFSQDQALCDAFARDEDIHARVASQVHHVPLDAVTPEMRRKAKAVNFGVIYGQTPFGLAKQLRRSAGVAAGANTVAAVANAEAAAPVSPGGHAGEKAEAAAFIDAYFQGYPGIRIFFDGVLADCAKTGYVSTILGRRRAIAGVRPEAAGQRNLAERTAINTVIQGSAADLIKQAMIAIHARLASGPWSGRMLLQIHDELVFEVPQEELGDLAQMVAEEMAGKNALSVPLKVDLKAGPNWADVKAISSA